MIGVLTQQSGPVRKGTSGASFAQIRRGISGVRRGQSRVAGWTGTSDAIGRADGAGPACLGEGADRRTQDQVRVGEPGTETDHADRGYVCGADSIDDIDVLRSGGMKTVFGGVYAPSTVGTLLREFTFGHARQLASVL